MRKLHALFLQILLCTTIALAETAPDLAYFSGISNSIIQVLAQNQRNIKAHPEIIDHAIRQYLLPEVDVAGMARSVLGRNVWQKASNVSRTNFTKAFTDLVIRTYAKPLADYNGEIVKFTPARQQSTGRFVRLNSLIIKPNGQEIPLIYSLVFKDGHWKIYDLSIEGVSLLQSFRNQFATMLQTQTLDEVTDYIYSKGKHV
jgi:phospholipid transport system substrate-binding protein